MKNILKKGLTAAAAGVCGLITALGVATPAQAYTLTITNTCSSDRTLSVNSQRSGAGVNSFVQPCNTYKGDIDSVWIPSNCEVRVDRITYGSLSGSGYWRTLYYSNTGSSAVATVYC